jgi:hypothetical protein
MAGAYFGTAKVRESGKTDKSEVKTI